MSNPTTRTLSPPPPPALALLLAFALAFAGAPLSAAFAQQAEPAEEAAAEAPAAEATAADEAQDTPGDVEEIVVTGSRIQKRNLVSASPVTQVDAEELLFQGTVRVEDMTRTLPQVWSNQTTGQSNGATGTATINLRELGEARTLVLINGRRMPVGSPIQGGFGADINQIPGALVERVEVLTGGAGAVYGSDAVAGVVNYVMKSDFEGVQFDYQISQYQHDNDNGFFQDLNRNSGYPYPSGGQRDGDAHNVSMLLGGNFEGGRGNMTTYATWRKIDPVWQRDRDYSACALNNDANACLGSSTIRDGRLASFGRPNFRVNSNLQLDPTGTLIPQNAVVQPGSFLLFAPGTEFASVPEAPMGLSDTLMDAAHNSETMHTFYRSTVIPAAMDGAMPLVAGLRLDDPSTRDNYGMYQMGTVMNAPVLRGMALAMATPCMAENNESTLPDLPSPVMGDTARQAGCDSMPTVQRNLIASGFDFQVADRALADFASSFNYGPYNYYQRPDERFTLGGFGHYNINEYATVYGALNFMDNRTVSQIAYSGAFFVTDTLSCGNALLSDEQRKILCEDFGLRTTGATVDDIDTQAVNIGRRNVEGGFRRQDLRHTMFRAIVGSRGDMTDIWSYDASIQYSEVDMRNTYSNDLSRTRIERALDAVRVDENNNIITDGTAPEGSRIVCRSAAGPNPYDTACVPWNIFDRSSEDAVTQEQTDYLTLPLFARGTTDQFIATGFVSGNLGDYGIRMPDAETGMDVVMGLEFREQNLDFNPDEGYRSGDGAGQGGATPAVRGGYTVREIFVESKLPLVEGKTWVEELIIDAGYRYSNYSINSTSSSYKTSTYAIRVGWAINNEYKFRGSFQRAVRAPSVRELFRPQGFNLFGLTSDPCGGSRPARTLEECMRTGVTAGQYGTIESNPAGQYNFLQGGNTNLKPEEADTFSAGFVYTPNIPYLEGLTTSLDFYSMKIEKGISGLQPRFILNQCLSNTLPALCDYIRRNEVSGDLWVGSDVNSSGHIIALEDNLAIEEVQGIDINADYAYDIGTWGVLEFTNVMAILTTWDQQEVEGAPILECKGTWGDSCTDPKPDFRNNFRTVWQTPWNVRASMLWRHISEVDDINALNPSPSPFQRNLVFNNLDAANFIDLAAIWNAQEWLTIRAGVNNVFDEEPPVPGAGAAAGAGIQGNGNVFPNLYDSLGRYIFLGATLRYQ